MPPTCDVDGCRSKAVAALYRNDDPSADRCQKCLEYDLHQ